MKKTLFFVLFAALPGILSATTLKLSLSEAIKNNTVKAEGINFKGGYHGKTTQLTLTNNTKSVVQIKIDPGVVFKADDDAYQPMVLAGDEFVMIMPNSEGKIEVYTFCGNAPKHSPSRNLHYSFSHVGSDTLIKAIVFLKKTPLFERHGQDVVWIITNNHSIGDIYSSEMPAEAEKLRNYLCEITGRPKPDYLSQTVNREAVPNEPAYVPKTMKIIANFEIILDAPKTMTLGIYNDSGKMVQKVFENQSFGKSGHRFGVEFEAEGALQGKYYIRLKEGEMVLKEQMVKVD